MIDVNRGKFGHRPTWVSEQGGVGVSPTRGGLERGPLKTLGKRNVSGRAAVGSSIASSLAAVSQPSCGLARDQWGSLNGHWKSSKTVRGVAKNESWLQLQEFDRFFVKYLSKSCSCSQLSDLDTPQAFLTHFQCSVLTTHQGPRNHGGALTITIVSSCK